jgi:hypothetical protein
MSVNGVTFDDDDGYENSLPSLKRGGTDSITFEPDAKRQQLLAQFPSSEEHDNTLMTHRYLEAFEPSHLSRLTMSCAQEFFPNDEFTISKDYNCLSNREFQECSGKRCIMSLKL